MAMWAIYSGLFLDYPEEDEVAVENNECCDVSWIDLIADSSHVMYV